MTLLIVVMGAIGIASVTWWLIERGINRAMMGVIRARGSRWRQ